MKLSDYLKSHNISQTDFSKSLGVSGSHISQIRKGTKNPSTKLAKKIEQATDGKVSVIELLDIDISFKKRKRTRSD